MLVDSIKVNVNKQDAMKKIFTKTPLVSKVIQFNNKAKDIHLEYIEFKILTYEIVSKKENRGFLRNNTKTFSITMIVNTYSGYSESIDYIPNTVKRYISKSCIKKSKLDDNHIIEEVKNQIVRFLGGKYKQNLLENINIQNIKLVDVKSIYKPYWVANYKGKNILMDA